LSDALEFFPSSGKKSFWRRRASTEAQGSNFFHTRERGDLLQYENRRQEVIGGGEGGERLDPYSLRLT